MAHPLAFWHNPRLARLVAKLSSGSYPRLIIICVGAALRLTGLTLNPVALNQDEAANGYDAFAIAHSLRDHHGHLLPIMLESFEDWASPVLTYWTVPFVALFGLSESVVRAAGALAATAAIPLVYQCMKGFGLGRAAALVGAALLATAPWHIPLSRFAIPPSILATIMLAAICAFQWAAVRQDARSPLRWAAFVALAFLWTHSYPTQKVFALILVFVLLASRWTYSAKTAACAPPRRTLALVLFSYLAVIFPTYLPSLLDPARYNARFHMVALDFRRVDIFKQVWDRYSEYLAPRFLFGVGDSDIMHQVPQGGPMFAIVAPFFYLGIAGLVMSALNCPFGSLPMRRDNSIVFLAWLVLFPLAASMTVDHRHLFRVVHGMPLVVILSAFGMVLVIGNVRDPRWMRFAALALVAGCMGEFIPFAGGYWTWYRDRTRESSQYGLREAFEHALAVAPGYETVRVTKRINCPYIYYLFFSKLAPAKLPYAEVNEHVDGKGGWLLVTRLGQWRFEALDEAELAGARVLHEVRTGDRVWYRVLANGSTLYID